MRCPIDLINKLYSVLHLTNCMRCPTCLINKLYSVPCLTNNCMRCPTCLINKLYSVPRLTNNCMRCPKCLINKLYSVPRLTNCMLFPTYLVNKLHTMSHVSLTTVCRVPHLCTLICTPNFHFRLSTQGPAATNNRPLGHDVTTGHAYALPNTALRLL